MSSRRPEDPSSTFEVTFPEVPAGSIYAEVHPPRASPGRDILSPNKSDFFRFAIYRPRGEDKTEVVAAKLIKRNYQGIGTFFRSSVKMEQKIQSSKRDSPSRWFDTSRIKTLLLREMRY